MLCASWRDKKQDDPLSALVFLSSFQIVERIHVGSQEYMLKRACMGVVLLILTLTMAACSTETIEPATSKFSTGSDDANTIPTDDLETSLLPNEAFENVLLNQRQFFYTNSNSNPIYQSDVYLSEIAGEDQNTMSLSKFAVVDMDGDELPEVVYQRGDYMGFIVLRYKDGDIYGYDVNYRGLTGLKKDGSYSTSSGASNTSVGKMRFLGELFDTDVKFSSVEQETVSYYLNGTEIDEVTFNQLWDEYEKLPDVDWYEYTESAVKEWLPHYFEAREAAISYEYHSTPMQDYLDSLSDLLYNDYSTHGDNTEDEYNAIFQNSYDGWDQAMATIYTLCQDKLTGSAKDVLEAEQQQWLDMREQMALNTPIFLVTDMTKMRTYDLISLYFEDHFYD